MLNRIFIIYLIFAQTKTRETKMILVINRHGARHSYANIENPQEIGQLTTNGFRMGYILGKFLRQKYNNFFTDQFDYQNSYIIASQLERCKQTAQAIMLGLFDFEQFNEELKVHPSFLIPEWFGFDQNVTFKTPLPKSYQPMPIQSYLENENFVFEPDEPLICPQHQKRYDLEDSIEISPILKKINEFLPKLNNPIFDYKKLINKDKMEYLKDFSDVPDYYISQRFRGNDLGLSYEDFKTLERIDTIMINYQNFKLPEINKYIFTELAKRIIIQLENLLEDIKINTKVKKFALFSGHDTNVLAILLAGKLVKFDCLNDNGDCTVNPPYCSFVLFEVYQENDVLLVESTYNGNVIHFCTSKTKNNDCTLEEFIENLRNLSYQESIEEVREKFCFLKSSLFSDIELYLIIASFFNLILIFVLVFRVKVFLKKNQNLVFPPKISIE